MNLNPKRITVVVLGDVGRSPRMQYHALSLSELANTQVTLVGLAGEPCLEEVQRRVKIRTISDWTGLDGVPWIVRAPLRAMRNACLLFIKLVWDGHQDAFLVQNPPAIPTLFVCLAAGWWTGSAVIVDWHNLGFKMLEHGGNVSKSKRILAKLSRIYEKYCGKLADGHICVTKALSKWLMANFKLGPNPPSVVYDRPHREFRRLQPKERIELLKRLGRAGTLPETVCFDLINGKAALVVSSTSWTPDEDFSTFLSGLMIYAQQAKRTNQPRIVAVVTGIGPLRAQFEPKMQAMETLTEGIVRVMPAWLYSADYPLFLGAADLGICMHTSTSGLDLPMKVVDMFGASLPVLAINFACLGELVVDGKNGKVFKTDQELALGLVELLEGFPVDCASLNRLQKNLERGFDTWQTNWEKSALPLIQAVLDRTKCRSRFRGWFSILAAILLVYHLVPHLMMMMTMHTSSTV